MALKIKDGSVIYAYGEDCKPFTSETNLSQECLDHLQSRFPDDIEGTSEVAEPEANDDAETGKPKKKQSKSDA